MALSAHSVACQIFSRDTTVLMWMHIELCRQGWYPALHPPTWCVLQYLYFYIFRPGAWASVSDGQRTRGVCVSVGWYTDRPHPFLPCLLEQ